MFDFELRNIISISCVIYTNGNENNVKYSFFWRITVTNFIEAA